MLKNRTSWLLVLTALITLTYACSQEEKEPPAATSAEKPAPQAGMDHAREEAHQGMEEMHETMKEGHRAMEEMHAEAKETHEEMKTAADSEMGQAIYEQHCASCHDSGLAGAPKTGDKEAWADHIAHGLQHMVTNAINGIGSMPPKGGAAGLSDEEVRAAVAYMMKESQ